MSSTSALSVFLYTALLFIIIVIFRLLWRPLRLLLAFCKNSAIGCALILVINSLFAQSGIQIAINAVTLLLCGFLGVGGVAFLAVFNVFL